MTIFNILSRNLFLPLGDVFAGTSIYAKLNFLERSQWWSEEELQNYQDRKLRLLIEHVYENVPFYRRVMSDLNLKPSDIRCKDDLKKMSIITKEDIRTNFDDFKSLDLTSRKIKMESTGGTSGDPLRHYYDFDLWSMDWACCYRGWGWRGYKLGDKMAIIGGSSVVPNKKKTFKKIVRDKLIERRLLLSAFDMGEKELGDYSNRIIKFGPKFLRGYPTAIQILAEHVNEHNLEFPTVKSVFTTAETLFDEQRKNIEYTLGCKVFDEYGTKDGGGQCYECHEQNGLHISTERGIIEFLGADNEEVSNERGRMVLTDINNFIFPFIRYDIGDIGILSDEKCACGRNLPLIKKIEGRITEIIKFSDGTRWSGPVLTLVFKDFDIKQWQIVQEDYNKIKIKIIPGKTFNEKDTTKLLSIFNYHVGEGGNVELEYVDNIPLTKSGKRLVVISKIKNQRA